MTDRCCQEFSRRAVAGAGIRPIEPGMPQPAGTGLTRRSFLARSLGLALTVYGAGSLGAFDWGIAEAARGAGGPILVSVFLPGGADGMSMLYPAGDPLYTKLRPGLALSGGQVFSEDDRLSWDPALAPLAQLHGEGKVTVMPAIGYSHPNQSHFTSRHYWEVGATDEDLQTGWMGRYLDAVGTADNPLQGLSLTGQLEPTLATATVPVAAISAPNQYSFWAPDVWGTVGDRMVETLGAFGRLSTADPAPAPRSTSPSSRTACASSCSPSPRRRSPRRSPTRRPPILPAAARRPRGDDRRRPAAPLRRARGKRRVRHACRPALGALDGARPRRPPRSSPSSATSRRAASPTGC